MADQVAHQVTRVYSVRDDLWGIEFTDGVELHCAKVRDEARIEALIAHHADNYDDPDHTARMRAMIVAVREHEAQ